MNIKYDVNLKCGIVVICLKMNRCFDNIFDIIIEVMKGKECRILRNL